jgi:hypothetical protein
MISSELFRMVACNLLLLKEVGKPPGSVGPHVPPLQLLPEAPQLEGTNPGDGSRTCHESLDRARIAGDGQQQLVGEGGYMDLFDLLENVRDRQSFMAFAEALAEERDRAEEIELNNPDIYVVDGALGWKNASISQFIEMGLTHFEGNLNRPPVETPTWKDIAMFLWRGKIIE